MNFRSLLQVIGGVLCFCVYVAVAAAVGGVFGPQLNITPGLVAVFAPLAAVGAFVWIFDARPFGRGFVLGIVLAVVISTAAVVLQAIH